MTTHTLLLCGVTLSLAGGSGDQACASGGRGWGAPNIWVWLFNSCEQQDPVAACTPALILLLPPEVVPPSPAASTQHSGRMETLWPPSSQGCGYRKKKAVPHADRPFLPIPGSGYPAGLASGRSGEFISRTPNLTQGGQGLWGKCTALSLGPLSCSRRAR